MSFKPRPSTILGSDGRARCFWAASTPDYMHYHDTEWGRATYDDHRLYEKLCLEGFQSGLSWLTILRKRDDFRRVFANFDPSIVQHYDEAKVEELLQDASIVRHRGKIMATINNASCVLKIANEFGSFSSFVWDYQPARASRPKSLNRASLMTMTTCAEAIALSKELKRRGFQFVGPTTVYAFMQAMGMVDDHMDTCEVRA